MGAGGHQRHQHRKLRLLPYSKTVPVLRHGLCRWGGNRTNPTLQGAAALRSKERRAAAVRRKRHRFGPTKSQGSMESSS